ncbi:MAG: hypothetical protein WC516_08170 [Patescibacteria group bacterium]|jgi:hypothetical protein
MGNLTDALIDAKGLIKLHYNDFPRHFGNVDITEVIEFAHIANEHRLTNKQYETLIHKSEMYFDTLSNDRI